MYLDHVAQMGILKVLLFKPLARFVDLNITGLPTNHFTFHLQHLIEKGIIEKVDNLYRLTPMGLEISSRLDVKNLEFVHQPKLGVSICVTKKDQILLGRRLKNPNIGEAGFFAEKIRFNESIYDTAKRCLLKETGLTGDFIWCGEIHLTSQVTDVVFTCFKVTNPQGVLETKTLESENFWVSLSKIKSVPKLFPDFPKHLSLFLSSKPFFEEITIEG